MENYLIEYFQNIREIASSSNDEQASLSQMMLLVAIHMSSGKGDELANLISSVLGYTVSFFKINLKLFFNLNFCFD